MINKKRLLIIPLLSSFILLTPIVLAACHSKTKQAPLMNNEENNIKQLHDLFNQNNSDQPNQRIEVPKINFDGIKFNKIELGAKPITPQVQITSPNQLNNQIELDPNKVVEVIKNANNDLKFGYLRFVIKLKTNDLNELKKEASKLFATSLKNYLDGIYYQLDTTNQSIVLYVKDLLKVNLYKQLLTLYFNKSDLVEKITLFLVDRIIDPKLKEEQIPNQNLQLDPDKVVKVIENKSNETLFGSLRFVIRFKLKQDQQLEQQALTLFKTMFRKYINDIVYALNKADNEIIIYPKDHSKLEIFKKILTYYFNVESKVENIKLYLTDQIVDYQKYQQQVKYKHYAYTYLNQINQPVYVLEKVSNQISNEKIKQNFTNNSFLLINDWNTFEQQEYVINNSKYLDLIKTNLMSTVDLNKHSILVVNGLADEYSNTANSNHYYGWNFEAVNINHQKKQIDLYLSNNKSFSLFNSIFNQQSKKYQSLKVFFIVIDKIKNPEDFNIVINHSQTI